MSEFVNLPADSNQARGIAESAIDFVGGKTGEAVAATVWQKLEKLHIDSVSVRGIGLGTALQCPDCATAGGVGISHNRQRGCVLLWLQRARENRKSRGRQFFCRARMGFQRHEFRL